MPVQLSCCAFATLLLVFGAGCHSKAPEHEVVTAQGGFIRLDLQRVGDGNAHFFTYHHDSRNVNFFIRTDGEGTLRAHFDACYSCFKYKRGYVQQSNQVVCIACRIGYDLNTPVWDYVGACVPITLKCRTEGSELVLQRQAIEKGSRFF